MLRELMVVSSSDGWAFDARHDGGNRHPYGLLPVDLEPGASQRTGHAALATSQSIGVGQARQATLIGGLLSLHSSRQLAIDPASMMVISQPDLAAGWSILSRRS